MIGVFFAEGFEEIEALTVVDILRRAGLQTEMISITDEMAVEGSHGIEVTMDACLADVDVQALDMIVLPGGQPGTKNLELCSELMQELDIFEKAGKPISAICAAPTIFGHRGYLEGREACCYPGLEEQLRGAKVSFEPAVVDEHITTARGMGCAIDFALAIVERFQGKEAAEKLGKAVVYRV
jgi:4-methyl-5(b-hydroxyethyl)-thiazole monophosphate biosynthesis